VNSREQEKIGLAGQASAAVIVAHPDDETLWAGGVILLHPTWRWSVATLCRRSDADRAPKFATAMKELRAEGAMGDLDDGPEQTPLDPARVRCGILSTLPPADYDLIITHSPFGEYTRHRRHEEAGQAVLDLWEAGRLNTKHLWMFAYEDGRKRHLPRAAAGAHRTVSLPPHVWRRKRAIITAVYGFRSGSYEARTAPREEAFWAFDSPSTARAWVASRRHR
jgi:hypothetical protein